MSSTPWKVVGPREALGWQGKFSAVLERGKSRAPMQRHADTWEELLAALADAPLVTTEHVSLFIPGRTDPWSPYPGSIEDVDTRPEVIARLVELVDRDRLNAELARITASAGASRRLAELLPGMVAEAIERAMQTAAHQRMAPLRAAVSAVQDLHRGGFFAGRTCCSTCIGHVYPCRTMREVYAAQGMAWRGWERGEGGGGSWNNMTAVERELSAAVNKGNLERRWTEGIGVTPPGGWVLSTATIAKEVARLRTLYAKWDLEDAAAGRPSGTTRLQLDAHAGL